MITAGIVLLVLLGVAVLGAIAVALRLPRHWLSAMVLFVLGAGMLFGMVLS